MHKEDLKIVIGLARTYNRVFTQIEAHLKTLGVNASEFGVLEFLYHKGTQPVQKIAEKILVTSGTITYNLNKLTTRGLIERRKSCDDGRVYSVSLTEKGRAYIADIFPKHEAFLATLFAGCTAEEKRLLTQALKEFYNRLGEI